MAKRRKRRSKRATSSGYPPIVWMLFGLAIGLSVAFAVYMKDRTPLSAQQAEVPQPASMQGGLGKTTSDNLDANGETAVAAEGATDEAPKERRFTFYDILPNFEVVTPDEAPDAGAGTVPRAVEEPGVYVLQAGSFSTHQDADRRRAELALHGIESRIQRVKVNDRDYHRVYVGPIDDLDKLNMIRSRLRAAKIDVFRIRLSD